MNISAMIKYIKPCQLFIHSLIHVNIHLFIKLLPKNLLQICIFMTLITS